MIVTLTLMTLSKNLRNMRSNYGNVLNADDLVTYFSSSEIYPLQHLLVSMDHSSHLLLDGPVHQVASVSVVGETYAGPSSYLVASFPVVLAVAAASFVSDDGLVVVTCYIAVVTVLMAFYLDSSFADQVGMDTAASVAGMLPVVDHTGPGSSEPQNSHTDQTSSFAPSASVVTSLVFGHNTHRHSMVHICHNMASFSREIFLVIFPALHRHSPCHIPDYPL